MQYINNNILCLEYEEIVPDVFSFENYKSNKKRGNITVHGVGGNGRTVLIEFETLPPKYKTKVRAHYGDPYEYASKQPILNSLVWDHEAESYYNSYVLPNGDKLPNADTDLDGKPQINYVKRYAENATWLNMLIRLTTDKVALKRELGISVMTFWETATEIMKIQNVDLPKNAKRLKAKIKEYKDGGLESLIEVHKFGNCHSKKVADETAEAFLQKMLALRNKHDDTIIMAAYNRWAAETDRKTITAATVAYRRKKWETILLLEREGVGYVSSMVSKKIKRYRATAPLLFINADDNVMDLFFRNGENKWYRPMLYVVTDTYNDLILGYAWGDTPSNELIKEAFRNAHRYVTALTGDAYVWQELQTDRWGIGASKGKNGNKLKKTNLHKFYESMSTFTPAALKNPNSKYIERSFGTVWHQVMKACFPTNYSGHNITSKEKINRDELKPANFPNIDQAPDMIAGFIQAMRNTKRKGCELTRQEEWIQRFNESDKSKKRLLAPDQRLQIFGKLHEPKNGSLNTITSNGLMPTLLGEKREYELSQQEILQHIGKKVQVYYDECDLSQVLITDSKGLRLVVNEWNKVPSAFADYEEGDAARIRLLQEEKKTFLPVINKMIEERSITLERAMIDATSRIMAGVMKKEIAHADQKMIVSGDANKTTEPTKTIQLVPEDDNDNLEMYPLEDLM